MRLLSAEDVYTTVGYGGVSPRQIQVEEEYRKRFGEESAPSGRNKTMERGQQSRAGSKVSMNNLLIRFSKYCNPVREMRLLGLSQEGGISIHCKDCPNVLKAGDKERLLNVYWQAGSDISYPVEIEVTAMDRPNLLAEVMYAVSESKVNITAVNGRTTREKIVIINLTFVVKDLEHLEHIINKIKRVKDVFSVRRHSGDSPKRKATTH